MEAADWIGWGATAVLFATLGSQVYEQWKTKSDKGVSPLLFCGQVASSILFTAYSALQGSMVFVASNIGILLVACVGQGVYWLNARHKRQSADAR